MANLAHPQVPEQVSLCTLGNPGRGQSQAAVAFPSLGSAIDIKQVRPNTER
jgi:hypothetical protein